MKPREALGSSAEAACGDPRMSERPDRTRLNAYDKPFRESDMSRLLKLSLLVAVFAVALGASAIAVATTGGRTSAQPAAAPRVSAVTPSARFARTTHRFRGAVRQRNQSHHWFRMHTTTNRNVRIYTNRSTYWDDCDWGDMSYGHHIDVRAYRSQGRWMAARMQNWDDWDMGDWGD